MCAANTYSNAGASACTSCDSDYSNSGTTAASHAGVASCKVTCAAGTYVASANAACTDVGSGYYTTASQTISQGSTGSRSACSSLNAFYTASDSGRNATTDCYGTTSTGKFVKTAKSGEETCTAGGYCAGSVKVYYNSTGGRTGCGGGKYSAAGSDASSDCAKITAGCYGTSASSSCPAVCAANTYSNAGASSCSSCPTDYKNSGTTAASHAGSASCIITVTGGYYIGTAGDNSSNWDQCADGTYKASHAVAYGSTSSCSTCPDGYAGSDGTRAANTSCYAACSAKTITGGSTTVVNAKEYYNGSAYPACTYNVNCKARYGASGNKTSNPACTLCNSTQYSAGGTATCEDCSNAPEHAYYSGGPFASSACEWLCKAGYVNRTGNQCAQICTAGFRYLKSSTGVSIPLYTSAQTTHSIVVQSQSGAMCYANLAEGEKAKAINVNLNGTTYHAIY